MTEDPAVTRTELLELADEPALARRRDALAALAGALTSDDAHHWARVNLFEAFNEDSVVDPEGAKVANSVSKLEMLRNILILLPLLITWWGISRAVDSYGAYLRQFPEEGTKPFVQLWQEGFGHGAMTLSQVAMIDVVMILFVIGANFAASYQRRKLEVAIPAREGEVWNRLQGCITDASVHLARRSFDSPLRFNELLTAAAQELERVHTKMRGSVDKVTSLLTRANDAADRIGAGAAILTASTDRQAESAAEVRTALTGLAQQLAAADGRADDLLDRVQTIVASHEALVAQVDRGLDVSSTASKALNGTAKELSRSLSAHVNASASLLEGLQGERDAQAAAREALTATSVSFARSGETLQALLAQLEGAGTRLGAAAEAIGEQVGSAQEQVAATTDRLAAQIGRNGDRLSELSGELSDRVGAAGERISAVADKVGVSGEQLTGAAAQLAGQVNSALDQLTGTVDRLAQRLEAASAEFGGDIGGLIAQTSAAGGQVGSLLSETVATGEQIRQLIAETAGTRATLDRAVDALIERLAAEPATPVTQPAILDALTPATPGHAPEGQDHEAFGRWRRAN
jgi:methyl-accepting chemotaxis protein